MGLNMVMRQRRVIASDRAPAKARETEQQGAVGPSAPADLHQSCDVISHSLFVHFRSRQEEKFSEKMLAALRHPPGGHAVQFSE
jgi:6-phosphogluconate dehydrogenase (decarboxylating)